MTDPAFQILAINPGSTSTKIAWFENDKMFWDETIRHNSQELAKFDKVTSQFEYRMNSIIEAITEKGYSVDSLDAVVGRGGIIDPLNSGTYEVDAALIERLNLGKPWAHASNLGGILADAVASKVGIPAFIVDPVSVDELDEVARLSGLPEVPRLSLNHVLNVKAIVRKAASELGLDWRKSNYVVAHLGGGCTICAHKEGRLVDFYSGNDFGPFAPERVGTVVAKDLANLCFSGQYTLPQLQGKLAGRGGVYAYLGTSDMREVNVMIEKGDPKAKLVKDAMAYQVAQAIGMMAVVLQGKVDAILFTGGLSFDSLYIAQIQSYVHSIAPCLVYPGEGELEALAAGALRVLKKEEQAKDYASNIVVPKTL